MPLVLVSASSFDSMGRNLSGNAGLEQNLFVSDLYKHQATFKITVAIKGMALSCDHQAQINDIF